MTFVFDTRISQANRVFFEKFICVLHQTFNATSQLTVNLSSACAVGAMVIPFAMWTSKAATPHDTHEIRVRTLRYWSRILGRAKTRFQRLPHPSRGGAGKPRVYCAVYKQTAGLPTVVTWSPGFFYDFADWSA